MEIFLGIMIFLGYNAGRGLRVLYEKSLGDLVQRSLAALPPV